MYFNHDTRVYMTSIIINRINDYFINLIINYFYYEYKSTVDYYYKYQFYLVTQHCLLPHFFKPQVFVTT